MGFLVILYLVFDVCFICYIVLRVLDRQKTREKEQLEKLQRASRLRFTTQYLSNTLNRLDKFLDKWEELQNEDNGGFYD